MITKDTEKIQTTMNGQPFAAPRFAHTLRTHLYQEHFGLPYEAVKDPLDDELLEAMAVRSKVFIFR